MKRLLSILLAVSLCLTAAACSRGNNVSSNPGSANQNANSGVDSFFDSTTSEPEKPIDPSDITYGVDLTIDPNFDPNDEAARYAIDFNSWEMYLANPWNKVPDSMLNLTASSPELKKVEQRFRPDPANNTQLYFDSRAVGYLHAMILAAEKDGINLDVISAYRTNTFQTSNFNNKVSRVMAANPSLTREQAEVEAAKVVARPGTSEHQLGLAVDFNSVEDSFRNTPAYAWLVKHCTDYGFILRYDTTTQDKTGIIAEPWHYRFVGIKNAKMIEASGLCLEEFIKKYNTAA